VLLLVNTMVYLKGNRWDDAKAEVKEQKLDEGLELTLEEVMVLK
jgi:hypothetical protein